MIKDDNVYNQRVHLVNFKDLYSSSVLDNENTEIEADFYAVEYKDDIWWDENKIIVRTKDQFDIHILDLENFTAERIPFKAPSSQIYIRPPLVVKKDEEKAREVEKGYPYIDQMIGNPVIISESKVIGYERIRVKDSKGKNLQDIRAEDCDRLSELSYWLVNYDNSSTETGEIEIVKKNSSNNEETDKIVIPIVFANYYSTVLKELEPENDWREYLNSEYKFELKLPKECNFQENTDLESYLSHEKSFKSDNCNIIIDIYNSGNLSLEEWLARPWTPNGVDVGFGPELPISINNEMGYKGTIGCCMSFGRAVALSKNGKIYMIREIEGYRIGPEIDLWHKLGINEFDDIYTNDLYTKILTTFEFTE